MVHTHDMICECPTPLEHIIVHLFQQEPELRFKTPEKDLIKKCLTTTTTDGAVADPGDIGEGELNALFAQDFGEEDTAG